MSVIVGPNDVSVFWQAFQYLVMTAGEIMFSVTGLEFSYSQVCLKIIQTTVLMSNVHVSVMRLSWSPGCSCEDVTMVVLSTYI